MPYKRRSRCTHQCAFDKVFQHSQLFLIKAMSAFWSAVLLPVKCKSSNPLQIFLGLVLFFFQASEQQHELFNFLLYERDTSICYGPRRLPTCAVCKNVTCSSSPYQLSLTSALQYLTELNLGGDFINMKRSELLIRPARRFCDSWAKLSRCSVSKC